MYDIYAKTMMAASRADLHALGSPAAHTGHDQDAGHRRPVASAGHKVSKRKSGYRLSRMARDLFSL